MTDFSKDRKIVEALLEMKDDDQIVAPKGSELLERTQEGDFEGEEITSAIMGGSEGDYTDLVRCAGLVPRNSRSLSDHAELYHSAYWQNGKETPNSNETVEGKNIRSPSVSLRHNQMVEKCGWEPNSPISDEAFGPEIEIDETDRDIRQEAVEGEYPPNRIELADKYDVSVIRVQDILSSIDPNEYENGPDISGV